MGTTGIIVVIVLLFMVVLLMLVTLLVFRKKKRRWLPSKRFRLKQNLENEVIVLRAYSTLPSHFPNNVPENRQKRYFHHFLLDVLQQPVPLTICDSTVQSIRNRTDLISVDNFRTQLTSAYRFLREKNALFLGMDLDSFGISPQGKLELFHVDRYFTMKERNANFGHVLLRSPEQLAVQPFSDDPKAMPVHFRVLEAIDAWLFSQIVLLHQTGETTWSALLRKEGIPQSRLDQCDTVNDKKTAQLLLYYWMYRSDIIILPKTSCVLFLDRRWENRREEFQKNIISS